MFAFIGCIQCKCLIKYFKTLGMSGARKCKEIQCGEMHGSHTPLTYTIQNLSQNINFWGCAAMLYFYFPNSGAESNDGPSLPGWNRPESFVDCKDCGFEWKWLWIWMVYSCPYPRICPLISINKLAKWHNRLVYNDFWQDTADPSKKSRENPPEDTFVGCN